MKHLSALSSLLVCLSASAQTPYERAILPPGDPTIVQHIDAAVAPNGRVALLDAIMPGSVLTVLDSLAQQLWSIKIKPGGPLTRFVPYQVLFMPNGDLMLSGIVDLPNGLSHGLMRLDANGNVLWTRMYHPAEFWPNTYFEANARPLSDGSLVLAIWRQGHNSMFRVSSVGDVMWARTYDQPMSYESHAWAALAVDASDMIEQTRGWSHLRVDANGTVMFAKSYPLDSIVGIALPNMDPTMTLLSGGGSLITYSTGTFPAVLRCDANGDPVWLKQYDNGDYYHPWFTGATEVANNDILLYPESYANNVIGLRIDQNGLPIATSNFPDDFMTGWGNGGFVGGESFKMFGSADGMFHFTGPVRYPINGGYAPPVQALLKLHEDLILPCGGTTGTFTAIDHVVPAPINTVTITDDSIHSWSFKYALDTVIYTTIDACTFLLAVPEIKNANTLSVYPSPITSGNIATLNLGDVDLATRIECVASDGRVVSTLAARAHQQQVEINTSGFAPGLYLLRTTDGGGQVRGTCRLMVE